MSPGTHIEGPTCELQAKAMSEANSGGDQLDGLLELLGGSCELPSENDTPRTPERSVVARQASVGNAIRRTREKKYRRKTDPNRARNQRNAEIRELKREIEDLSSLLRKLEVGSRSKRRLQVARGASCMKSNDSARREGLVWAEISRDQLQQRVRAERENVRLRYAVEEYSKRVTTLHRSLVRSVESLRSSSNLHTRFINRVYGLPIDIDADTALYNELIEEIVALRGEADKMFELNGLAEPSSEPCSGANIHNTDSGRSLDMFLRGFLPFDLDATDDVIWQIYKGTGKHRGPLYFKSSKVLGSSNDTVLEKFALELFTDHTRADFRYRQVVRRYREADRVVIIWVEIVEPLELANRPFTRCGFRAKGVMVCEPMNIRSMPPYTHFRRCQRFTPYLTGMANEAELEEAMQNFSALINFIVSLDTAKVHFQKFQDELLRQSLGKQGSSQM